MAALIGALRVSLSADTAKFEAGMKRAQRSAATAQSGIGKSLGLIKSGLIGFASGLSIGLLVRGIKGALDYAGSLGEVAQQLGVTTKQLQVFRFAAGQVGISQEEMDKSLGKLTVSLGKARLGAEAPKKAFDELSKIIGKDIVATSQQAGDALPLVADALSQIEDRSKRAAIEVILFSRAGAKLDTLLTGGSRGIEDFAAALEKMGILLGEKEIRDADKTADKIEALSAALKLRVAGVVAENAGAIFELVNALTALVGAAGRIAGALSSAGKAFGPFADAANAALQRIFPFLAAAQALGQLLSPGNKLGKSATGTLSEGGTAFAEAQRRGLKIAPGSGPASLGNFLAPKGGGGRKGRTPKEDHTAEDALRDAFQFDQQIRRAQQDVLRATQDLATDYVERATIAVQLLDMEKAQQDAELEYEVALNKLTKGKEGLTQVQADQLKLEYDRKDQLERDKIQADEQAQRREDVTHLIEVSDDIERDKLASEAQLAETAGEQRNVQLRLLDLLYRQERARLEAVIAEEEAKDVAQRNLVLLEESRRRLAGLNATKANDQQAVIQSTRGPWEEFANTATDAKKLEEAFQSVAVNGVGALTDGLLDAIEGTKSLGEAFREVAQGIIRELLRIMIQKIIVQAIGGAVGMPTFSAGGYTGSGFATGGFTGMGGLKKIAGVVHAREFVLNAQTTGRLGVPALNALNSGAPLSAVSNDNTSMSGGPVNIHINAPMTRDQARVTGMQAARAYKEEIARSSRAGY